MAVAVLAIDPTNPSTLYAGVGNGGPDGGVFKTTNGGINWSAVNTGLTGLFVNALVIDPANPSTAYVATDKVYKTTNGGGAWSSANDGLSCYWLVYALAIDAASPATVYAGKWYCGVSRTTDGAETWGDMNMGLSNGYVQALVIDPTNPTTVYAGTEGGGVFVLQPVCGDGMLDPGEACDDGNTVSCDGCSATCATEAGFICGDSVLNTACGEQCDDGDNLSCDGCSPTCATEAGWICGDNVLNTACGEVCDDGNTVDGDGCDSNCTPTACGNGFLTGTEQCDDGNTVSGDGCSGICRLEPGARECQEAIAKAGAKFFATKLTAIQRCRNRINKNKLFIRPAECPSESSTNDTITRAGVKARLLVQRSCTDLHVAALAACADTVDGLVAPAGTAGCLISTHETAVDDAVDAEYGPLVLDPPPNDKEERKCQETVAKAGRKNARAVLKALQRCRNDINDGRLLITPAECYGDTDVAAAIARAGSKARAAVQKKCTDGLLANLAACATTLDSLINPTGDGGCLITSHRAAVDDMLQAEYGR